MYNAFINAIKPTMEILHNHTARITEKAKENINVKYILDLRDFDGLEYSDKFIKDFNIILNDPEIKIVVEVMGGQSADHDSTSFFSASIAQKACKHKKRPPRRPAGERTAFCPDEICVKCTENCTKFLHQNIAENRAAGPEI